MAIGSSIARGALWFGLKLVNVLYVPLFIVRLFQTPEKCPPIKDPILLQSAECLAQKVRTRELTSEAIVTSYISRVQEVDPVINAVVEDRFAQAIEDARKTDALIASSTLTEEELKTKYPLLGIPITVKESIAVEGMSNNAGRVCEKNKAKTDAEIVRLAKEAGAIPLLVSNTPELCMNWETINNVTGRTANPYDTTKTSGGSSGGEASLLASAASIIGLGSDICGSLRLPAHFCGVWGHKPSPGIVSCEGHYPDCKDRESWTRYFTLGPMTRYAVDLSLMLKVIVKPELKERLLLEKPVDLKDIKIYYIECVGSVLTNTIDPEIENALKRVVTHMETKYGNSSEKLQVKHMEYSPDLAFLDLLDLDEVEYICETKTELYKEILKLITFQSKSVPTTILYGLLKELTRKIPQKHKIKNAEKLKEMAEVLIDILKDNSVLLFPTFPNAAHPHKDIYRRVFDTGYLAIFNSLGFPVTNCPLGINSKGLPIGIQVVTSPFCDRLSLAVAVEIEKEFGGWTPPAISEKNIQDVL